MAYQQTLLPDADPAGKNTVTGTVSAVIYQNEENGYTVCEIDTGADGTVAVTGIMPYVAEGDSVTAMGAWINHPVYGRQFKAEFFERALPVEEDDILRYLKAGNVRGIGPKTAARIVERYGPDTFDVLENHPDWLAELPGISPKKAAQIQQSFAENTGVRTVMMFCRDFVPPAAAVRIYKKWGSGAVERLREDPYLLCSAIDGVGFPGADRLAASVGVPADAATRIAAGVAYVLECEALRSGHTCLPESDTIRLATELLTVEANKIRPILGEMQADHRLYAVPKEDTLLLFLPQYYRAEDFAARKLWQLHQLCPRLDKGDANRLIWQMEEENHLEYAAAQREAILGALESGVMILTGGPGTGKTTVIRALLSIFESLGMKCALAAPTGRAAKRMSEATAREAKTIHRLLEMGFSGDEEAGFGRDDSNYLDEDVVILDECSMIDVLLLESLLRAIKNGARLILIGDAQQLPSVGAGNVLGDLIDCGCFPTFRLTEIFRQARESLIVTNSHAINEGRFPDIRQKNGDFFFLARERDDDIAATVADLYKNRLPRSYGADVIQQIQVITPSHNGAAGTANLNRMLQEALNPPSIRKQERKRGDTIFREGDRVMQIKNDYGLEWTKNGQEGSGIFNGDVGVIEEIDTESETVTVNFDERITLYEFSMLDELEHAYAVTVHKSQGSEYPVVILPLFRCPPMLRTRNLLYTAVTRAARMAILVGRPDILGEMVANDRHALRCTCLARFVREAAQ